jgi:radical SAM protein with 4Fe4S-binding SPASM domain
MNMMPCSFANQDNSWFVNLKEHTIQEAWDSEIFEKFRYSLRNSCSGCKNKAHCAGGCPLVNQITLCNRKEKEFKSL